MITLTAARVPSRAQRDTERAHPQLDLAAGGAAAVGASNGVCPCYSRRQRVGHAGPGSLPPQVVERTRSGPIRKVLSFP